MRGLSRNCGLYCTSNSQAEQLPRIMGQLSCSPRTAEPCSLMAALSCTLELRCMQPHTAYSLLDATLAPWSTSVPPWQSLSDMLTVPFPSAAGPCSHRAHHRRAAVPPVPGSHQAHVSVHQFHRHLACRRRDGEPSQSAVCCCQARLFARPAAMCLLAVEQTLVSLPSRCA